MPLIFTLFALTATNLNAYLDPSTGSLLLSSIVAIFASLIYFFKNLFYKITSFSPKSLRFSNINGGRNRSCGAESIVFYCEGKQYYGTFKPILDTLDSLNHPYTYLTSDEADPALKRESNNNLIECIGVGNKAYTRLNMLKANICIMTTPSLQVLQIKRSRFVKHYCHITHSLLPMTYRTFGVDYFDSVLVANAIQGNFVREIEKAHSVKEKYIAIVGSTYLDELAKLREKLQTHNTQTTSAEVSLSDFVGCEATSKEIGLESIDEASGKSPAKAPKRQSRTILVSPSWGKESLLSKYGLSLLEPLAKSPYHIIIRPHPQSLIVEAESTNITHLKDSLQSYSNVEWDINTPNVIAFSKADLMIGDFSSVIFDFVCLEGKPVLTLDFTFDSAGYDLADIYDSTNISEFWTFKALKQIGGKISENDFANISEIIKSALQSSANIDSLNIIKSTLWQYPHNSGIQSTLEILKIERKLLETQLNTDILNHLDLTKNAIEVLESSESNSESHTDSHESNNNSNDSHESNADSPHSHESHTDSPKKDS